MIGEAGVGSSAAPGQYSIPKQKVPNEINWSSMTRKEFAWRCKVALADKDFSLFVSMGQKQKSATSKGSGLDWRSMFAYFFLLFPYSSSLTIASELSLNCRKMAATHLSWQPGDHGWKSRSRLHPLSS